jgi:UDP-N-acetylmuramyl pentapeptide synthase
MGFHKSRTPGELVEAASLLRPETIVAGIGETASWRPDEYRIAADEVSFVKRRVTYRVRAGGRHHLADALIAAALADALGVPAEEAAEGLADFRPLGMRSALRQFGRLTVIADCYNANPESFEAAIDYCREAFGDRRLVAVVGTMLELGDASEQAHRGIAERLVGAHFDVVAATGDFIPAFRGLKTDRNGSGFVEAETVERLWADLAPRLSGDEVVLVKASRNVRLEGIVERLQAFAEGKA